MPSAKRTFGSQARDRRFIAVMLSGFPALGKYITLNNDSTITVEDETFAGGGATFVIHAFYSLHHREPIVLQDIVLLDDRNRQLFILALGEWLVD
jgi:hypothetical protein